MTESVTAASADGTSDLRPFMRIAADLRRRIIAGTIPPGAQLKLADIASRYRNVPNAAVKALSTLKDERLVTWHRYKWYATPAGPPDPATGARLGVTLTRMRQAAGKAPDELSGAIGYRYGDVRGAEAGEWRPRDFWAEADTVLGADGTLLKLHDTYYAGPGPDSSDLDLDPGPEQLPEEDDGPYPPPRVNPATSRVAAEIAARITAGEWPPGTRLPSLRIFAEDHGTHQGVISQALREIAGQGILIRTDYGYFTPGPLPHQAPVPRTLAAVILEWDDGSRTRVTCTSDR